MDPPGSRRLEGGGKGQNPSPRAIMCLMENPGHGPKKTRYHQGHLGRGRAGCGGVLGQSGRWLEDNRDCSRVMVGRGCRRSPGDPQRLEPGGAMRRERQSESLVMAQRSVCTCGHRGLAGLPPTGSALQAPYTQSPGQAVARF